VIFTATAPAAASNSTVTVESEGLAMTAWWKYLPKCAICGERFKPKSPNQKYCPTHKGGKGTRSMGGEGRSVGGRRP